MQKVPLEPIFGGLKRRDHIWFTSRFELPMRVDSCSMSFKLMNCVVQRAILLEIEKSNALVDPVL